MLLAEQVCPFHTITDSVSYPHASLSPSFSSHTLIQSHVTHTHCVADLSSLREALAAEGSAAKDAEQDSRSLHARAVTVQRQLAVKEEECERVLGMLQVRACF